MRERLTTTGIYGILHFLVDFGCAFLIFRVFSDSGELYRYFLLYNFCAFALQMPLGLLADRNNRNAPTAALGCFLTGLAFTICMGAGGSLSRQGPLFSEFLIVIAAGIGNCLFHIGGGIEIINRSEGYLWPLGIFISPGAAGIFFGSMLGKESDLPFYLPGLLLFAGSFTVLLWHRRRYGSFVSDNPPLRFDPAVKNAAWSGTGRVLSPLLALLCLFLVVVLRSHLGMVFRFPWKSGLAGGLLALAAVVLGKASGGILADRFGTGRTAFFSMLVCIPCFFLAGRQGFGAAGLFFFNMSMPLTLYLASQVLGSARGFAFGLLTFALFLGFLPSYLGSKAGTPLSLGLGGILSLVLLVWGFRLSAGERKEAGNE